MNLFTGWLGCLFGLTTGFAQMPVATTIPPTAQIDGPAPQPAVLVEFSQLKARHQLSAPGYPPLARLAKIQGNVGMRITLDAKGRLEEVEALDGPPILRPAAVAFYRGWTFYPVEIGGAPTRAQCEFQMSFRLIDIPDPEGVTGISQAVVEVETGPSVRPVPIDVGGFQKEVGDWLARMGLSVVAPDKADSNKAIYLKLGIQAFRTEDGLYIHNLIARASLLADRDRAENIPGGPQRIHFINHILGQKGEAGFHISLLKTIRDTLQEFVVLPGPPRMPTKAEQADLLAGRVPPGWSIPEKSGITDFDFSQIKVKRQPPAPHYPAYAKQHRVQGTVVIVLTIDPTGIPIEAEAQSGPPALLTTAIGYALNWEFEPARLNGVPQLARFKLTMPFRLR